MKPKTLCIIVIIFIIFCNYFHYESMQDNHPITIWKQGFARDNEILQDPSELTKEGSPVIIYIEVQYNKDSLKKALPFMRASKRPFVVIFNADISTIPTEYDVSELYNIPNFKQLYSNNIIPNKYLSQMPLGIDFHFAKRNKNPMDSERKLLNYYKNSPKIEDRDRICIISWTTDTAARRQKNGDFKYNRKQYQRQFPKNLTKYEISNNRDKLWEVFSKSVFAICPPGAGLDTCRLWEALILGCIAIVESTSLDPLMKEFPVIILDEPSKLTKNDLDNYIDKYGPMTRDPEVRKKYTTRYWKNKMYSHMQ